MQLLDEVVLQVLKLKEHGIAIASVRCANKDETVVLRIGNLETRRIFDSETESTHRETEDDDLDLFHER